MRNALAILCLILWLILGWFYCQSAQDCCGSASDDTSAVSTDRGAAAAPEVKEERMGDFLMFNWSDNEPIMRDDWDTHKRDLIANLGSGEILEITGHYRANEVNNTNFENLGLARANRIKALFVPPLSDDRIELKSALVNDGADSAGLVAGHAFRSFTRSASIDESIPDKTIIRFPFNSTDKLSDREIESYLDQVAERVKSSGERVRLTGHTDDIGSTSSNMTLGQRRADIIKNYLVGKGVAAASIITNSRGESAPVASNATSDGRAQNRRTELEIIK